MKNDLMQHCKFYNGEKECPESYIDQGTSLFWYAERDFVTMQSMEDIESATRFYINCNLVDINYTLPLYLLACIFSRLCMHSDNSPEQEALYFRDVALPKYLAQPQK